MATAGPVPPSDEPHPFWTLLFGVTLGAPLAYLLFAALGVLNIAGNWGSPASLLAFTIILLHERFWIPLTLRSRSARGYQLGTIIGIGLVAWAWLA